MVLKKAKTRVVLISQKKEEGVTKLAGQCTVSLILLGRKQRMRVVLIAKLKT
jgi:hypothetical protein